MVNMAWECFFPLTLELWVSVAQHPQVLMWPFPPTPRLHVREVEGICAVWDLLLRLLLRLWAEGDL